MAIISIPSSIGGVSIPGITNRVGGPLAALFENALSMQNLRYPRDLGSAGKGHSILFSINTVEPYTIEEGEVTKTVEQIGTKAFSTIKQFSDDIIKNGKSLTQAYGTSIQNTYQAIDKKINLASTIELYMPDAIGFGYTPSYTKGSLNNTLLNAVGGIFGKLPGVSNATQSLSGSGSEAVKLALKTQGLALNPQEQILFDGIDFREYSLSFTFTPYSKQEAEDVKNIIKLFRQHSAPTIRDGAGGIFFTPPGTFDLEFRKDGVVNTNITKVKESVIQGIEVNYTPNGWAAHTDGAPVQTTLTLNFKETSLVDSTQISQGY